jgi:hypothetical protein
MSLTLAQQRLVCEYAPYVTVVYKTFSPLRARARSITPLSGEDQQGAAN